MNIFNKRTMLFGSVFFLYTLSEQCLYAQKRFPVAHYIGDNGLPQNSIKGIASDSDGFVWMIREDGLVRFDGHRFFIFNKSNLKVKSNRFYMMQPSLINSREAEQRKVRVLYVGVSGNEYVRIEKGKAVVDSLYYRTRLKSIFLAYNLRGETVLASGTPHYLSGQFQPSGQVYEDDQ